MTLYKFTSMYKLRDTRVGARVGVGAGVGVGVEAQKNGGNRSGGATTFSKGSWNISSKLVLADMRKVVASAWSGHLIGLIG